MVSGLAQHVTALVVFVFLWQRSRKEFRLSLQGSSGSTHLLLFRLSFPNPIPALPAADYGGTAHTGQGQLLRHQ